MTTEQKQAIQENGLLSELGYFKLETKYYQEKYGNDYSIENIKEYLNATEEQIKSIDPDYDSDSADKYRDIKSDRKDTMIALLDKYDIVETSPTNSPTDFQGTLVKNKETGEYTILFRGTESITDGVVDAAMITNFNAQHSEALDFTKSMMKITPQRMNLHF